MGWVDPEFELGPALLQAGTLISKLRRTVVWATPHPRLS